MHKRTAIVTGGAQGIGRVMTQRFLEEDYTVAVFDIDSEALAEAKHETKNNFLHQYECENVYLFNNIGIFND